MKNYAHIASRVLNTPLLLEPGYARTFFSALSTQLNIHTLMDAEGEQLTGEKIRMSAASFSASRDKDRPYEVVNGGKKYFKGQTLLFTPKLTNQL